MPAERLETLATSMSRAQREPSRLRTAGRPPLVWGREGRAVTYLRGLTVVVHGWQLLDGIVILSRHIITVGFPPLTDRPRPAS